MYIIGTNGISVSQRHSVTISLSSVAILYQSAIVSDSPWQRATSRGGWHWWQLNLNLRRNSCCLIPRATGVGGTGIVWKSYHPVGGVWLPVTHPLVLSCIMSFGAVDSHSAFSAVAQRVDALRQFHSHHLESICHVNTLNIYKWLSTPQIFRLQKKIVEGKAFLWHFKSKVQKRSCWTSVDWCRLSTEKS